MDLIQLTKEQKEEHQKWKTLFETKYKFQFQDPTYDSVPFVSNLMKNLNAQIRFKKMEYYLLGSYIINMNTNIHREMHKIRGQFTEEEYKWHQEHNKLGANKWGGIAGITLGSLNILLKRNDLHVASKLPRPTEYSKMSFEEKIEYVKLIDQKLYNLLERIYSQY